MNELAESECSAQLTSELFIEVDLHLFGLVLFNDLYLGHCTVQDRCADHWLVCDIVEVDVR